MNDLKNTLLQIEDAREMFPEATKRLLTIIRRLLERSMSSKEPVNSTLKREQDLLKLIERIVNVIKSEGKPRK